MYTLRYVIFNKPIIVNTYHKEGRFSQRGLRCNKCNLVKNKTDIYLSAHCLGKALDFSVDGVTSEDTRNTIIQNINEFEYPIRLEKDTDGWVHIDVYQPIGSEASLIEFNG